MSEPYTLLFNRGNGTEEWHEPFASIDDAVREANEIAEYGNGWWFQIKRGNNVVLDGEALRDARLAVGDEA